MMALLRLSAIFTFVDIASNFDPVDACHTRLLTASTNWGCHEIPRTAQKYMLGLNKQETLNTSNGANWRRGETSCYPPFASTSSAVRAVGSVKKPKRPRNTANNVVIMKHLNKLVNKIYTLAERDISGERKLQLLNVFWRLSSYFAVCCCLSLAVFRGLQLVCVSPFYHVRKIRIVVRLDMQTPF